MTPSILALPEELPLEAASLDQPAPADERQLAVLSELATGGAVSFQGLKRQLGWHPQILTRTLRRLEEAGWIVRTPAGYRLDPLRVPVFDNVPAEVAPQLPVIGLLLPAGVEGADVIALLRGRWARGLRWYGSREDEGVLELIWQLDPGGQLARLRVQGSAVTFAVDEAAADRVAELGRFMLGALQDLYQPDHQRSRLGPDELRALPA